MNRLRWIGQRLLQLIPVLIGITFVSFMLVQLTPGDPARLMLGNKASPEAVEAVRDRLGLNQPKIQQYFSYMGRLAKGDLGESIRYRVPVSGLISDVLPVTGFLALYVIILTIPATLILGVTAARRQGSQRTCQ